ncbi:MAG: DUF305 domain-containing protein [Patescibacteria group bacterium]
MKNSTILLGIALLIVGLVAGYGVGSHRPVAAPTSSSSSSGMHQMPDGSTMGSTMADMNAGLRGKTGDEFDNAFIDEMTIHHQGAIDMANLVLTTSKRPELIELARNIITAQSNEIEMMKEWREAWFK